MALAAHLIKKILLSMWSSSFKYHTDSLTAWNRFSATTQLRDLFAAKPTRNVASAVTTRFGLDAHAIPKPRLHDNH